MDVVYILNFVQHARLYFCLTGLRLILNFVQHAKLCFCVTEFHHYYCYNSRKIIILSTVATYS